MKRFLKYLGLVIAVAAGLLYIVADHSIADEYQIACKGSDLPPFNRSAAYKLFKQIFEPAEKALDGARHVFVVADGALQSLPLGVLVTGKPQGAVKGFADYRQVSWLAKKYALTTLPSVSSLRALRRFTKQARAKNPFIGFGDPLLKAYQLNVGVLFGI